MNDEIKEHKDIFISETREYITRLNDILIKLEKDPESKELVNELLRILHSIKSSSAMMGLNDLSMFVHRMEEFFQLVRDHKVRIMPETIDALLKGIDSIEKSVNAFERNLIYTISDKEISELLEILKKRLEGSKSADVYVLSLRFDETCPSPKLRIFTLIKEIEERGTLIRVDPKPDDITKDTQDVKLVFTLFDDEDGKAELEEILKSSSEINEYSLEKKSCDEIGLVPKELEVLKKAKPSDEEVINLIRNIEETLDKEESVTVESGESVKDYVHKKIEEIKVKVKSLDALFDLVGELILVKSRLTSIAKKLGLPELIDVISSFERISNELQAEVMSMRLVPLSQIFNLLPRYVRDLSKELGKEVDLIIEGREIAIDRKILEEIVDPLIHVVKNAIDHGIEEPEERVKKGKPRVGTVRVVARREDNYVVIGVEDDGRGLDLKQIRKVAVERGLINPTTAERLSDKEVLSLITLPGFTTREQATQVSGRGMGMNTVKEKLEALGGVLEISSVPDKGTKVLLKLPPSLAVIRAVIIRSGDDKFAVPVTSVESITILSQGNIKSITGNEFIYTHGGEIIPLFRSSKILNTTASDEKLALILRNENQNRKYALAIDHVEEIEEIVIKPLGKIVKGIKGFTGATILGDGKVCLVIDPNVIDPHIAEERGYDLD